MKYVYKIDYGYGMDAYFITPYPNVEERFMTLAGTCFGIRKNMMYAKTREMLGTAIPAPLSLELEYAPEFNEALAFSGDIIIWLEDGGRKYLLPDWLRDEEWDYDYADEVKYKE